MILFHLATTLVHSRFDVSHAWSQIIPQYTESQRRIEPIQQTR
jgi:hypothetical protein